MCNDNSRQWLVKNSRTLKDVSSSSNSSSNMVGGSEKTNKRTQTELLSPRKYTENMHNSTKFKRIVRRTTTSRTTLACSSCIKSALQKRCIWSWPLLARVNKLCLNQIVEVLLALILVNYLAMTTMAVATAAATTTTLAEAEDAPSLFDSSSGSSSIEQQFYRSPHRISGYFGYNIGDLATNQLQRSQNYKISPKPCSFGRVEGTCMFVWECIKSEGRHVGMCVDSFMFGSCCSHNDTDNILSVSSSIFSYTRPTKPVGGSGGYGGGLNLPPRPRPPHLPHKPVFSGMTTIERPHGAGTLVIRPSGPHHQGALHKPQSTKVPVTTTTAANVPWSSNSVLEDQHSAASIPTSSSSFSSSNFIWHSSSSADAANVAASTSSLAPAATHHQQQQQQHWHMTTEPNFITKPRPPSWDKPMPLRPQKPQKPTKKPIVLSTVGSEGPAFWPQTPSSSIVYTKPPTTKPTTRPQIQLLPTSSTSLLPWKQPTKPATPYPSTTTTQRPYTRPTFSSLSSSSSSSSSSSGGSSGSTNINDRPTIHYTTQQRPTTAMAGAAVSSTATQTYSPSSSSIKTTQRPSGTTQAMTKPTRHSTTSTPTPVSAASPAISAAAASETAIETNEITALDGSDPSTLLGTVKTISAARSECGVPVLARPETRIVGGKSAAFGRWPWQVSVRRTSFFGFSSTHRCGGALINENWIATAGHCVDDLLISQIRIRVGEYDFSHVQEQLPYIERGVAKKVVHPKYNFFTYEYDLALVKLESPLEFAPHVSPICLPETESLLIGMNATVTGWGRLSEGGTLPSVLQEVSVPIVSNDNCKSMFLRAGRQEFIPDIFLCAGFEGGGQDSCQGDSGGPLQAKSQNGRFFLAGIISWGIGCAEANLPGVCTRISKFVPWILSNVR